QPAPTVPSAIAAAAAALRRRERRASGVSRPYLSSRSVRAAGTAGDDAPGATGEPGAAGASGVSGGSEEDMAPVSQARAVAGTGACASSNLRRPRLAALTCRAAPHGGYGEGWSPALGPRTERTTDVTTPLRLMAVHAHPDDESSKGA